MVPGRLLNGTEEMELFDVTSEIDVVVVAAAELVGMALSEFSSWPLLETSGIIGVSRISLTKLAGINLINSSKYECYTCRWRCWHGIEENNNKKGDERKSSFGSLINK